MEAARVLADSGAVELMVELAAHCDDRLEAELMSAEGYHSVGRFADSVRMLDRSERWDRGEGWQIVSYVAEGQFDDASTRARRRWVSRAPSESEPRDRALACVVRALEARTGEMGEEEELEDVSDTDADHGACRLLMADLRTESERLELLQRRQRGHTAALLVAEVDVTAADQSAIHWPDPAALFNNGSVITNSFGGLERAVLSELVETEPTEANVFLVRAKLRAAAAAFAALVGQHDEARASLHRAQSDLDRAFPDEARRFGRGALRGLLNRALGGEYGRGETHHNEAARVEAQRSEADRSEAYANGREHLKGLLAAIELDAGNGVRARELLTGAPPGSSWAPALRLVLDNRETRAVKRRNHRPGREPEEEEDEDAATLDALELARTINWNEQSPEELRTLVWTVSESGRSELAEAIRYRDRRLLPEDSESSLGALIARAGALRAVAITLGHESMVREQNEILERLMATHFRRDVAVPLRILASTIEE